MTIKIEERKDYELYITKLLKDKGYPENQVPHFVVLMMASFDDGVRYNNKDLKVEIDG